MASQLEVAEVSDDGDTTDNDDSRFESECGNCDNRAEAARIRATSSGTSTNEQDNFNFAISNGSIPGDSCDSIAGVDGDEAMPLLISDDDSTDSDDTQPPSQFGAQQSTSLHSTTTADCSTPQQPKPAAGANAAASRPRANQEQEIRKSKVVQERQVQRPAQQVNSMAEAKWAGEEFKKAQEEERRLRRREMGLEEGEEQAVAVQCVGSCRLALQGSDGSSSDSVHKWTTGTKPMQCKEGSADITGNDVYYEYRCSVGCSHMYHKSCYRQVTDMLQLEHPKEWKNKKKSDICCVISGCTGMIVHLCHCEPAKDKSQAGTKMPIISKEVVPAVVALHEDPALKQKDKGKRKDKTKTDTDPAAVVDKKMWQDGNAKATMERSFFKKRASQPDLPEPRAVPRAATPPPQEPSRVDEDKVEKPAPVPAMPLPDFTNLRILSRGDSDDEFAVGTGAKAKKADKMQAQGTKAKGKKGAKKMHIDEFANNARMRTAAVPQSTIHMAPQDRSMHSIPDQQAAAGSWQAADEVSTRAQHVIDAAEFPSLEAARDGASGKASGRDTTQTEAAPQRDPIHAMLQQLKADVSGGVSCYLLVENVDFDALARERGGQDHCLAAVWDFVAACVAEGMLLDIRIFDEQKSFAIHLKDSTAAYQVMFKCQNNCIASRGRLRMQTSFINQFPVVDFESAWLCDDAVSREPPAPPGRGRGVEVGAAVTAAFDRHNGAGGLRVVERRTFPAAGVKGRDASSERDKHTAGERDKHHSTAVCSSRLNAAAPLFVPGRITAGQHAAPSAASTSRSASAMSDNTLIEDGASHRRPSAPPTPSPTPLDLPSASTRLPAEPLGARPLEPCRSKVQVLRRIYNEFSATQVLLTTSAMLEQYNGLDKFFMSAGYLERPELITPEYPTLLMLYNKDSACIHGLWAVDYNKTSDMAASDNHCRDGIVFRHLLAFPPLPLRNVQGIVSVAALPQRMSGVMTQAVLNCFFDIIDDSTLGTAAAAGPATGTGLARVIASAAASQPDAKAAVSLAVPPTDTALSRPSSAAVEPSSASTTSPSSSVPSDTPQVSNMYHASQGMAGGITLGYVDGRGALPGSVQHAAVDVREGIGGVKDGEDTKRSPSGDGNVMSMLEFLCPWEVPPGQDDDDDDEYETQEAGDVQDTGLPEPVSPKQQPILVISEMAAIIPRGPAVPHNCTALPPPDISARLAVPGAPITMHSPTAHPVNQPRPVRTAATAATAAPLPQQLPTHAQPTAASTAVGQPVTASVRSRYNPLGRSYRPLGQPTTAQSVPTPDLAGVTPLPALMPQPPGRTTATATAMVRVGSHLSASHDGTTTAVQCTGFNSAASSTGSEWSGEGTAGGAKGQTKSQDMFTCKLCGLHKACWLLVPCHHFGPCEKCVSTADVSKYPVCRICNTQITSIIRTFV